MNTVIKQSKTQEKRLLALIEHSFDAIALINPLGKILYLSRSLKDVLGYENGKSIGLNGFKIVHPHDLPLVMKSLSKIIKRNEATTSIEIQVKHKDGTWRWVEVTGTNLLRDPDVRAIVAKFRDITVRKTTELHQHLLDQISIMLTSSLDYKITLNQITKLLVPTLANYSRIIVVDENNTITEVAVKHVDPKKVKFVKALYKNYKGQSDATHGVNKMLYSGKPEMISQVTDELVQKYQSNSNILQQIKKLGLTSYMGVPLIARGKIIGAITFSSTKKGHTYGKHDLVFAEEIARRVALALDNARLYQEAQKELAERIEFEKNLEYLSEASKVLSSSLNYKVTTANIAKFFVSRIADWCAIDIKTENGVERMATYHNDPKKVQVAQKLSSNYPLDLNSSDGISRVFRTGKSELFSKIPDDSLIKYAKNKEQLAMIRNLKLTSVMIVPLLVRDHVTGIITFVSAESGRRYTKSDLTMAEEFASRASLALENARLYAVSQKAISLRDEFISVASHELKTPVTSLKMYTQIMQKQLMRKGEVELAKPFTRMDMQISKLTVLIDNLLNVSKIQHGKLEFTMEEIDINELVKDTVEAIQTTDSKHNILISGKIPHKIYGDRYRIYQVITNLLTNAIKYSPQADKIFVELQPEKDKAVVRVKDLGIGIEKEHQKKIFDQFYRVTNPEEKTYPGLGMGLYIANEIIIRHKGTMNVSGSKGKGSTFSFTLPYKKTANPTLS